jgi:hypothetical protein
MFRTHAWAWRFTSCPSIRSAIASSSAWLPLLYDSVVLVLTLLKTVPLVRKNWGSFMGNRPWKRLVEDGLLYYT